LPLPCQNETLPLPCQNESLIIEGNVLVELNSTGSTSEYNITSTEFTIYSSANGKNSKKALTGYIGRSLLLADYQKITVTTSMDGYKVEYNSKSRAANISFNVNNNTKPNTDSIECKTHLWKIESKPSERYALQEFEDCFNLDNSFWYGGAESYDQQYWPINKQQFNEYMPYLTGLFGKWSSILERYWITTSGVAIVVDHKVPLFALKNETIICFLASSKYPYLEKNIVSLKYDICQINSQKHKDSYLNKLQLYMINNYFSKPKGRPDQRMMKSPIW
jgi:hypothetical protein